MHGNGLLLGSDKSKLYSKYPIDKDKNLIKQYGQKSFVLYHVDCH